MKPDMNIVITGADGFMGRNLRVRLRELGHTRVTSVTRSTDEHALAQALAAADLVFHLAGVNRPADPSEFGTGNADFTARLCDSLAAAGRRAPVVFASSSQSTLDNAYGRSKRAAEDTLLRYAAQTGAPAHLLRLNNVFGKWSRPNYNSAVATFCHNTARGLPIQVNDPAAPLTLVYVDDVIEHFVQLMNDSRHCEEERRGNLGSLDCRAALEMTEVAPQYSTTVGELARQIQAFKDSRTTLMTERVGAGLVRALYATYVSFLPPEAFGYEVPRHADPRGVFVEMLKTPDCGQFSYFTAHPGITRGEHYHHSKTEKFLVIKGSARFGFRHIETGQTHEVVARGGEARVVETVPGWTHNITNIGHDELIVMLWANEVFDRMRPDTVALKVNP